MHTDEEPVALLRELEESLLEPSAHMTERVSRLLAERFVEFGSSGRTFNKARVLASLGAATWVKHTATELKVELLGSHTALVTYRACRHTEPPVHTLRSSIWQQLEGHWQMVFHQGTITSVPT